MSSKNINFSFDIVNKLKAVMADVATVAIEKEELIEYFTCNVSQDEYISTWTTG